MKEHIIGSTKAAIVLADKLSNIDNHTRKKIMNFLGQFNRGLNQLNYIPDFHVRMAMANTWFDSHKEVNFEVDDSTINTYTNNVIKVYWRTWVRKQPTLDYIHARQSGDSSWRSITPSN